MAGSSVWPQSEETLAFQRLTSSVRAPVQAPHRGPRRPSSKAHPGLIWLETGQKMSGRKLKEYVYTCLCAYICIGGYLKYVILCIYFIYTHVFFFQPQKDSISFLLQDMHSTDRDSRGQRKCGQRGRKSAQAFYSFSKRMGSFLEPEEIHSKGRCHPYPTTQVTVHISSTAFQTSLHQVHLFPMPYTLFHSI